MLDAERMRGSQRGLRSLEFFPPLRVPTGRSLLGHAEIIVNNSRDTGTTPLMIASEQGYANIVEMLLALQGVDVNQRNVDDFTAYQLASIEGHSRCAELLLMYQNTKVRVVVV